ncbi:MAG: ester cyclase [Terriglobales bacterium]|jgi:steroid delta-isomerase-like uncharacterized protein
MSRIQLSGTRQMAAATSSSHVNVELVRRWFQQVWNEGRIETVEELLASDAVVHGLGEQGKAVRGPKAFLGFFITMRSAFPDMRVQVEQVICEGEWFATRFSAVMTYTGEGLGFPANWKKAKVDGMAMGRIVDGKIAEAWNIWDQRALLTQLGAADPTRLLR